LQGVLNYVILRPLMTVVTVIAMLLGTYDDGSLAPTSLYTYVSLINATSQMWALYCLVLMYKVGVICLIRYTNHQPPVGSLCGFGAVHCHLEQRDGNQSRINKQSRS